MRTQAIGAGRELLRLIDAGALAWLVAIEVDAATAFYLTTGRRAIVYADRTWSPYPMRVELLRDDGEGNLPTTTITLSNVGRSAMPYLEARTWDQGAVTVQLVFTANPDGVPINLRARFAILSASASWESVTLKLGQPSFYSRQYPARRFVRADGFPGIPRNRS